MPRTFANGYALLIAVDEHSIPANALPIVAKDVAAVAAVLTDPDRCGYQSDHVRILRGKSATRQNILQGLDWLSQQIVADKSGNATAIVYYSGHGAGVPVDDPSRFYLIPYDTRADHLFEATALRAEDFAGAVAALAPRRLLAVLDCCHAGGMDVKGTAPSLTSSAIPVSIFAAAAKAADAADAGDNPLGQGAGRAALSSSTGRQLSYLRKDGSMSSFTYHLIEALIGHAEPKEGATEVLVSDIVGYVHRRVPKSVLDERNAQQQPEYHLTGNFPVALLLGGEGLAKGQTPPSVEAELQRQAPTSGASRADQSIVQTGAGSIAAPNFTAGQIDSIISAGRDYAGGNIIHNAHKSADLAGSSTPPGTSVTPPVGSRGRDAPTGGGEARPGAATAGSQPRVADRGESGVEYRELVESTLRPVLSALAVPSGTDDLPRALDHLAVLSSELRRGQAADAQRVAAAAASLVREAPVAADAVRAIARARGFEHLALAMPPADSAPARR